MTPSSVPPPDFEGEDASALPAETRKIDSDLSELFAMDRDGVDAAHSPENVALVNRILDATLADLPAEPGNHRIQDYRRATRFAGGGALAAAVLLLVLVPMFWLLSADESSRVASRGTAPDVASVMPVNLGVFGAPRESEVMLAAVLDPQDDWLADFTVESDPGLDVGMILESRSFDIVDLEDDLVSMLRHSTS